MLDIFLPIILAVSDPEASQADRDMCARVLELQPRSDPRWACTFASWLNYLAAKKGMDPRLSLAIAMQESSLNPDAVSPTNDKTVFQLSPGSIKAYKIDRTRLKDIAYVTEQHLLLLKDKLDQCRDRRGWSCYHSKTPALRKKYEQCVLKYY